MVRPSEYTKGTGASTVVCIGFVKILLIVVVLNSIIWTAADKKELLLRHSLERLIQAENFRYPPRLDKFASIAVMYQTTIALVEISSAIRLQQRGLYHHGFVACIINLALTAIAYGMALDSVAWDFMVPMCLLDLMLLGVFIMHRYQRYRDSINNVVTPVVNECLRRGAMVHQIEQAREVARNAFGNIDNAHQAFARNPFAFANHGHI